MYSTSKKVLLKNSNSLYTWLISNKKRTKLLAILQFVVTLVIAIFFFGLTSGFLFWLFTVIFLSSLITVLYPLEVVHKKHIIILFITILIFEIILNY